MKSLGVFLLCLGLATCTVVQRRYESKNADKDFLVRQKNIFQLLYHVHQPNIHKDQVKIGQAYSIKANLDNYVDVVAVKSFLEQYENDLLAKGTIFSINKIKHMQEVSSLFSLLFFAKDYETFYKTACWAREHVNEQLFVYVVSVAVLHRPDCQGFILPPPYEIHPYYFFSSEVIEKAYFAKMQGHGEDLSSSVHTIEENHIIINSNYSGWYVKYNEEQQLSYFTEDIGLNSFYYNYHLDYPFWMNGDQFNLRKDKRGEMFYYIHQQILARYYLERLSNGLGEIAQFSWRRLIKTGYYPSLKYFNGMEFPFRPNDFKIPQEGIYIKHLIRVEDYERRIRDTIDSGLFLLFNSTQSYLPDIEVLGAIIEASDSPKSQYYGTLPSMSKKLLGNSFRSQKSLLPSALEHYQTCLRDPMFYQLVQRYVGFFRQFKNTFPPYTKEELVCPGVRIEDVEVEKLVTYFDNFDIDITNVVYQNKQEAARMEDSLHIKARQPRLNHLPFTVTTNVFAEKASKVVFKLFLGPKYDGEGRLLTINKNRLNFVKLDSFIYELKVGKNTVQRNSREFRDTIRDFTSSRQVYSEINESINGTKEFPLDMSEAHNGFPERLILPKGRTGGMPFYLYVIVAPYTAPAVPFGTGFDHVISSGVGSGARFIDGYSMGYPFDRRIEKDSDFILKNMHFEDVVITHKKETDINQAF